MKTQETPYASLLETVDAALRNLECEVQVYEQGLRQWAGHNKPFQPDQREDEIRQKLRDIQTQQEQISAARKELEQLSLQNANETQQLEGKRRELAQLEQQLHDAHSRLAHDREILQEREHELAARQKELEEQQSRKAAEYKQAAEAHAQAQAALDAQRESLELDRQEFEDRLRLFDDNTRALHEQESELKTLARQLDARREELSALEQCLTQKETALAAAQAEISRRHSELNSLQESLAQLEQKLNEERRQLAQAHEDYQRDKEALLQGKRALENEWNQLHATREENERLAAQLTEREAALQSGFVQLQRLEGEYAARMQLLNQAQEELEKNQNAFQEAQHRFKQLEQEVLDDRAKREAELQVRLAHCQELEAAVQQARESVEQKSRALEKLQAQLEQHSRELDDRTHALATRESELAEHQTRLEAALADLQEDKRAADKARTLLAEVETARQQEYVQLQDEIERLRQQLAQARAENNELQTRCREKEEALLREAHDARVLSGDLQAQRERAAELEERISLLNQELQKAIESARIQTTALDALKQQFSQPHDLVARLAELEKRENDLLALMEDHEAARKRPDTPLPAHLPQEVASVVTSFWSNFVPASQPEAHVHMGEIPISPPAIKSDPADASTATAMRDALAAARAELCAADQAPIATASPLSKETPSLSRKASKAGKPEPKQVPDTDPLSSIPKTAAPTQTARSVSMDLEPAMAARLRTLRRVNPTKSDEELLKILMAGSAKPDGNGKSKPKKRWFSR